MRGVVGLLLLVLGSSLFGLSIGVVLSLLGGDGYVYYGPVSVDGSYFYTVNVDDKVVGVGYHGIIGCIVYTPPNSTLIVNAKTMSLPPSAVNATRGLPLSVSVSVDYKYRGNATLLPFDDSIVADLVHFSDQGLHIVWINVSIPERQDMLMGIFSFSLYGPGGGWVPVESLVTALAGALLAFAGYRLLSGLAYWSSMIGLVPLLVGVSSIYYGLSRPLVGILACYWPIHVPQGWSPERSFELAKMLVSEIVSNESPIAGASGSVLIVFSVISISLASTASIEWGLGEFEVIVFFSRRRLFAYKVIIPLIVYSVLPALLVIEAHLALYGAVPGWSLVAALYASASFIGLLLLAAGVASLVGMLSGRASLALVAGVSVALLPTIGRSALPSPGTLFSGFWVRSPLSHTYGSDSLGYLDVANYLLNLLSLEVVSIVVSLALLAASYIAYSRWEP